MDLNSGHLGCRSYLRFLNAVIKSPYDPGCSLIHGFMLFTTDRLYRIKVIRLVGLSCSTLHADGIA